MLYDVIFDLIKNVNLPTLFEYNISSQSVAIVASQMLLSKTNLYKGDVIAHRCFGNKPLSICDTTINVLTNMLKTQEQ